MPTSTRNVSIFIIFLFYPHIFSSILIYFANNRDPITSTITQKELVTPTPIPADKPITTTTTTKTLYVPGNTKIITTTDPLGTPLSSLVYVPPSTIIVKQVYVVTVATKIPTIYTTTAAANKILYDFNSQCLWGVTMTLAVISTTLVFMSF